jgi:cellulose synthase/poly-beta-1,6-N-acetylglucosamine synthase-like glycosyltransferase
MIHSFFQAWIIAAGLWMLLLTYRLSRFFDQLEELRNVEPFRQKWPKLSLVVPACNEEDTIGPAVESLLQIDYPNIEFIMVDDRSSDQTGAILNAFAQKDARLQVVSIRELPEGWLGKVNALSEGLKRAQGEWVLFTDADVHYRPLALKKAITVCVQRTLDFLCVAPSIHSRSVALKAFIAQFLQNAAVTVNLRNINDPLKGDCLGAGAFSLVRRQALENSKGFEWLRLEVIDDIGLAQTLKESGAKLAVMSGIEEVEIEWYKDVPSFVRGVEKNSFSAFQYSFRALGLYIALSWWVALGITLVPWWAGDLLPSAFTFVCTVLYLSVTAMQLSKALEMSPLVVLFYPLTSVLLPLIVLRAAWLTTKQKGIYWRKTFYALDELKKYQRIRPFEILFGRAKP